MHVMIFFSIHLLVEMRNSSAIDSLNPCVGNKLIVLNLTKVISHPLCSIFLGEIEITFGCGRCVAYVDMASRPGDEAC